MVHTDEVIRQNRNKVERKMGYFGNAGMFWKSHALLLRSLFDQKINYRSLAVNPTPKLCHPSE